MSTENYIWHPDPLGTITLAVTIFLDVLCIIVVATRSWTRLHAGLFALDDVLMVIAVGVLSACCSFTCLAVYTGLGTRDARGLEVWNISQTTMNIVIFQVTYAWSLPFIKSSICLTMLRIITAKPLRVTIWMAMVASIISAAIGFVSVVALCQPLAYYWDTSIEGGWCASTEIVTGMSYLVPVMAIITDWTCSLVPCYVVWNLQMKSRLKASVCAVLALGIIASAATVIRLPYLQYYNVTTDYYYNVCNIVLLSIIECGVGTIAGSLPSLRTLLKSWIDKTSSNKDQSYQNTPGNQGSDALDGIKSQKSKGLRGDGSLTSKMKNRMLKSRGNTTFVSASRKGDGTWMELDDDSSQKHMIHRTVHVSVDVSDQKTPTRDDEAF